MTEPQHQQIDWSQWPLYTVAVLGLLGWTKETAPKVWGWLARMFESETARRQKVEDEINSRRKSEDERVVSLYEQIRTDDKETINVLRGQVNELIRSFGELQRAVGQNQQTIQETQQKVHEVEKNAVIITPNVLSQMQKQAEGQE